MSTIEQDRKIDGTRTPRAKRLANERRINRRFKRELRGY